MHGDVDELADLMSALVRLRAKEHDVATTSSRQERLERFAAGNAKAILVFGMAAHVVGAELEALLNGELALGVDTGRMTVSSAVVALLEAPPCEGSRVV